MLGCLITPNYLKKNLFALDNVSSVNSIEFSHFKINGRLQFSITVIKSFLVLILYEYQQLM